MKEFYVISTDEENPMPKYLSDRTGHATMAFWRECEYAKNKCVAMQHLENSGATVQCRNWNREYLFNFPTEISMDDIRKAIYTAHDLCRTCKGIKIH